METIGFIVHIALSIVAIACSALYFYIGYVKRTGKKIPFFERVFDLLDAIWWYSKILKLYITDLLLYIKNILFKK